MALSSNWGALEADFQRFYQRDLREDVWGPHAVGCRRLWALVQGLPMEAALWRDRMLAEQPGAQQAQASQVETDPNRIKAFFGGRHA